MTKYPSAGRRDGERRDGGNVELVQEKIRRRILSGELPAGESFSQVQLAAQCGVSRTPLREAVRMLQREGLLIGQPNHRFVVAPFSVNDLEQIFGMRLVLEATAIRVSVPQMSPEDIADLRGHLARMDHFAGQGDFDRWEVPHREFHMGLIAHAGERFLVTLSELSDHAERYRRYYTANEPKFWAWGAQEHKAIFDAVQDRDVTASARSLIGHTSHAAHEVIDMLQPGYEPAVLDGILRDVAAAVAAG